MLAIVMIMLILSCVVVSIVLVIAFCSVAFADPKKCQGHRKEKVVHATFDDIRNEKIDSRDPSSRTYGELIDEERARMHVH